jgi:hypothetical protein
MTGTVSNYAGFNFYFQNGSTACNLIDASAYAGIQFTIYGTIGTGTLSMGVSTAADDITYEWLSAHGDTTATESYGSCTPKSGTNQYDQTTCAGPETAITIASASTPTLVQLPWSSFKGGKPLANPDPAKITAIYWRLGWSTGLSYDVDIHVDDIAFMAK